MNKRRLLYIFIGFLFLIGLYVIVSLYNPPKIDILNTKADTNTSANQLSFAFLNNEELASKTYVNKVIIITGTVKKITYTNNRNTIILQGNKKNSYVICDVEPSQLNKLKQTMIHKKITIKGICKGHLKDVIMLNCILINTPNHE